MSSPSPPFFRQNSGANFIQNFMFSPVDMITPRLLITLCKVGITHLEISVFLKHTVITTSYIITSIVFNRVLHRLWITLAFSSAHRWAREIQRRGRERKQPLPFETVKKLFLTVFDRNKAPFRSKIPASTRTFQAKGELPQSGKRNRPGPHLKPVCIKSEAHGPGRTLLACGQFTFCPRIL